MKLFAKGASILAVVAGISSAAVLSQIGDKSQKVLPAVQVNRAKIEVLQRSRVAFRPFDVRDPKNGKPISRDALIEVPIETRRGLLTVRRMRAGEYYDQLNRLEKDFNDLGYSLKTDPDNVLLQRSKLDKLAMNRVKTAVAADHKRFDPVRMIPPRTLQQFRSRQIPSLATIGRGKLVVESTPYYDKSFIYQSGDPDLMSSFVRGGLRVEGSKTQAKVSGEFAVGGVMFKKSADIARMSGSMVSPAAGVMTGKVDLVFLGFNVHTYTKNTSEPFVYDSGFTKEFRSPITTLQFMLGPVPMTGEVGIIGRVGVKYGISLRPLSATGLLAPYANIGAYAEVGAGIPICSGGVGIELIFVEDRVEFSGEAAVQDATTAQPYLLLCVSGTNVLEMLAGRVYFWVKIPVPTWKPPFWKKKKYDWEVFEWDGIKAQGVLFNSAKRVNL